LQFEDLSYRYLCTIQNFPRSWIPFVHLYDPDLPLFPLHYFHVHSRSFPPEEIPDTKDRAYGFIEEVHPSETRLEVSVACNKDLHDPSNSMFLVPVLSAVEDRLGISNPVMMTDVSQAFPLSNQRNVILAEIWRRVVSNALGESLPFGRFFDPIFGLARLTASFYSPGGRKTEWIQTHYFCSRFGEKVQVSGDLPRADFYLLPSFEEVSNQRNPISPFPKFQALLGAARDFHNKFCRVEAIGGGLAFSKFVKPTGQKLNTDNFLQWVECLHTSSQESLIQCFNAFDKGPLRTIMFLQMLNDLRSRRLSPQALNPIQVGLIYDELRGFYQTPKVIALFAQQCFGNPSALPIDTWVETFMKWPLGIYPTRGERFQDIFVSMNSPGKMERLVWIAAQARKIHSSLCDDALWCLKYDSTGRPRGANPFSCNACILSIRNACPAYAGMAGKTVSFNDRRVRSTFRVWTSHKDNTTPNQRFVLCEGEDVYGEIHDDFTPVDAPSAFASFPRPGHRGQVLSVDDFVRMYQA